MRPAPGFALDLSPSAPPVGGAEGFDIMNGALVSFWASLGFILGIAAASLERYTFFLYFLLAFFLVWLVLIAFKRPLPFLFFILFLGVSFGLFYGSWRMQRHDLTFSENERVELSGKVVSETQETKNGVRFDLEPQESSASELAGEFGHIRVFTVGGIVLFPGDKVKVAGILEKPASFSDFNYPRYLESRGVSALMYNANVFHIVRSASLFPLAKIRNEALQTLTRFVHGVSQEILGEMTLGYGNLLSDDVGNVLSRAGIRHITSISGMHIALIIEMLLGGFLVLGFRFKLRVILALAVIVFFIIFIGAPASALRAGIMGGVFYLGALFGRPLHAIRLLLYAAVAMLIANPFLLFYNIGFELSFAAMLGIIILTPFFELHLARIPLITLRRILAMTTAATLFTLPLTIFHFGIASLVGLLANVLVVPTLIYILPLAFAVIIAGFLWPDVASILGSVAEFFTNGVFQIAKVLSSVPYLVLDGGAGSLGFLVGGYMLLGVFIYILIKKKALPLNWSLPALS